MSPSISLSGCSCSCENLPPPDTASTGIHQPADGMGRQTHFHIYIMSFDATRLTSTANKYEQFCYIHVIHICTYVCLCISSTSTTDEQLVPFVSYFSHTEKHVTLLVLVLCVCAYVCMHCVLRSFPACTLM